MNKSAPASRELLSLPVLNQQESVMINIPSFETVEAFEAFWSQVPDLIEIELHPTNKE